MRMNYNEVISYLDKLSEHKIKLGLEGVSSVLELLKNPHKEFKFIHIAGTNGKGSTAAFLESILRRNGYRVGLYTSPHLVDIRERIQIDRQLISKDDFADCVTMVSKLGVQLTFFETLTMAAFLYFSKIKPDWVVLETGLGGRLDATNVVTPQISIITSTSMDHEKYLGNNICDIAKEKAGIIKKGIPVVVSKQDDTVINIFKNKCEEVGTKFICASPALAAGYKLGLKGEHQTLNAATALAAIDELFQKIFPPPNPPPQGGRVREGVAFREALEKTTWPGRLEEISKVPHVIVDCAHNPGGMNVLAEFVRENLANRKVKLLIGVMGDKDISGMLEKILPVISKSYAVTPKTERALSSKDLNEIIKKMGYNCEALGGVAQGLEKTLSCMSNDETLIVSGSIYTVGETLKYFENRK